MADNTTRPPPFDNIKRPEEVIKLQMTDNLKFSILDGMINVGQVSNREVNNAVLHLVSCFFSFFPIGFLLMDNLNKEFYL